MPIQEANIVFVESQVMDDVPEGGGALTGRVIQDGRMNNVFEDISDLDRAYGRFNLRKIGVAVRTLSTDLFGGAKSVITELPEDPDIAYTLFQTADAFDTRAAAANRVESYLYKGPMWAGYLYENHISGMRAINIVQRVGSALPPIGKTLCLVQDEGLAGEKEQYIRVTKVTTTETVFTDGSGEYIRWVVNLELSDALRHNFNGHTPIRQDTNQNYTGKTRVRDTTVADATRYYGGQALAAPAAIGDLTVRAASMFTQLVPSAQTETPLVSQVFYPELVRTVSAGARNVEVAQQAHTLARQVTAESRRFNWIETLSPLPAASALAVSYRAQGNWYTLTDNGAGQIAGTDPAFGAGTIDYATGALSITLGALPDVGSQIIIGWASPVHYLVRAGATADAGTTLDLEYTLENAPIVPGSVTMSYPVGGVSRTVTDPSSNGNLSGAGVTGTINYATGEVWLKFSAPPDRAAFINNAYTWRSGTGLVSTATSLPVSGGTFTVPGTAPFRSAGSMTFQFAETTDQARAYITSGGQVRIFANRERRTSTYEGYIHWPDQQVGTFNTATGVVTLTGATATRAAWNTGGAGWLRPSVSLSITSVSDLAVERDTDAFDPNAITDEQVAPSSIGLTVDLTTTIADPVIPNSVRFTLTGKTYDDRNGLLYTDINPSTGVGLLAGSIDYETGICEINFWADNAAANVSVSSCLTVYGQWTAIEASFRTALAPVKPEALSIVAVTEDGDQITASADQDGVIAGPWMRGEINYEFGTAWVEFGQMDGGEWVPRAVLPDTLRYNAVAYSYLPLDADILGIDAVRLPADGRVPIYRPGDIALLMHAADVAPATPTLNAESGLYELDCGRTRVGWVRLTDANGDPITEAYELDRANGTVLFDDIAGLATPIAVRSTVADLRMITDVQINGEVTLARPITHDFPAGESILASCLIHGDRRARVSATWDQQTWNGTWSDSIVGAAATATLNLIDFPITVTNEGCDTDRWLLRWTNPSAVELISEKRGLVWSGTWTPGGDNIAPINPRTRIWDDATQTWLGGTPYLVIPGQANGGGWAAGNVVRINTVGAIAPLWLARAIQQSDEPLDDGADGCELYCLGNVDRP